MDCMWRNKKNHCTRCAGACPFSCFEKRAIYCDEFIPEEYAHLKMSAMEKQAAWADVKAKGEAIVAAGGVQIMEETPREIVALVMSGDVAGQFPVTDGGPYEVILSKKSWENENNVGGWLQGYLCDCLWGQYHSGSPGPGFQGRFCSHAYAAMVVSDARARQDFMNDRTAKLKYLGKCTDCGNYSEIDAELELCSDCERKHAFEAVAKAIFGGDESELEDVDGDLIDQIADEMVIEQRKQSSIARWEGYQAIFSEKKTANDDYIPIDDTPFGYWCNLDGFGRWEVLFTVHTEDYDGKAQDFMNRRLPQTHKVFDRISDAVEWAEQCARALKEYKEADNKKTATKIKTDSGTVSLEQVGGKWCLYPDEQFAYEFDLDPDENTGGPFEEFEADDYEDAVDVAVSILENDWNVWVRSSSKKARSKSKVATRAFTYAEIKELEDEVIDKPWLHNADRLKTREGLIDVF